MHQECRRTGEEIGEEEDGLANQKRMVRLTRTQRAKESQEQEKEAKEDSKVSVSNAVARDTVPSSAPTKEKARVNDGKIKMGERGVTQVEEKGMAQKEAKVNESRENVGGAGSKGAPRSIAQRARQEQTQWRQEEARPQGVSRNRQGGTKADVVGVDFGGFSITHVERGVLRRGQ